MAEPITLIAFKVGELLVDEIREQIAIQGHNMTGALSKSVEHKERITTDGVVIQFLLAYPMAVLQVQRLVSTYKV